MIMLTCNVDIIAMCEIDSRGGGGLTRNAAAFICGWPLNFPIRDDVFYHIPYNLGTPVLLYLSIICRYGGNLAYF